MDKELKMENELNWRKNRVSVFVQYNIFVQIQYFQFD